VLITHHKLYKPDRNPSDKMAIVQSRSKKKQTGSRYVSYRRKRVYELGRLASNTKVGKEKKSEERVKAGIRKIRLFSAETANIFDPKTKKYQKSKIKSVAENTANRHFVRRNIITKGAVIETEAGKAKVTSRPGQEGIINAILI
jgi:small subunit ribosomal protein S8e